MEYNIVELYCGFYKCHHEKYYNTDYKDDTRTENYAKNLEIDTIEKYLFTGLYTDYPSLKSATRDEVYEILKKDGDLYSLVDEIFTLSWG